jgi:MHS family proline/betaine transporter-like MFS transporter
MLHVVTTTQFVTAWPAFALLTTGEGALTLLGLVLMAAPYGLTRSTQLAPMLESFPTRIRFTGLALTMGVAVAFIAGPTPYVATWLVDITGNAQSPAWLLMAVLTPSLIGAFWVSETARRPLPN